MEYATRLRTFFGKKETQSYLFFTAALFTFLFVQKTGFEWKWCHLFFSYEFGFLKRGLVGALFRILSIPTTWDNFALFSALMLVGVILTFHNLVKKTNSLAFFSLSIFFIGSPVLLRNLVHDWGRFDQLAIMLVFLLIYFSDNIYKYRVLLGISPILLFIHEGTLLWIFPTLVAITFVNDRKSVYVLTPVWIVCAAVIFKWGNLNVDQAIYTSKLIEWAKPIPIYPQVVGTLTDSFDQVIAASIPTLLINIHSTHGLESIGILLSVMLLLSFIRSKILVGFALASLVAGGILFAVAVDHFRWVSLLCFIVLFYLLYAHQRDAIRWRKALYGYLLLLGILGLYFDPIGVFAPYGQT